MTAPFELLDFVPDDSEDDHKDNHEDELESLELSESRSVVSSLLLGDDEDAADDEGELSDGSLLLSPSTDSNVDSSFLLSLVSIADVYSS